MVTFVEGVDPPGPPDHENNLFGDGSDGEKKSLLTASDVRDQATKPASEESEPVSLRTRSKLVMDGGDAEHTSDDDVSDDADEDVQGDADPASRHNTVVELFYLSSMQPRKEQIIK